MENKELSIKSKNCGILLNNMFVPTESEKNTFLEQTKVAREVRANEKRREVAAICMQSLVRGFLARRRYNCKIHHDFDELFKKEEQEIIALPVITVFPVVQRFVNHTERNLPKIKANVKTWEQLQLRVENLCRYLNKSMENGSFRNSYAALSINKDYSLAWIAHIKTLLNICCRFLQEIKPESHTGSISLALFLHSLIIFTSPKSWGIAHKPQLDKLPAAMQKICCNIQGDLVKNKFYITMRVSRKYLNK